MCNIACIHIHTILHCTPPNQPLTNHIPLQNSCPTSVLHPKVQVSSPNSTSEDSTLYQATRPSQSTGTSQSSQLGQKGLARIITNFDDFSVEDSRGSDETSFAAATAAAATREKASNIGTYGSVNSTSSDKADNKALDIDKAVKTDKTVKTGKVRDRSRDRDRAPRAAKGGIGGIEAGEASSDTKFEPVTGAVPVSGSPDSMSEAELNAGNPGAVLSRSSSLSLSLFLF